MMGPEPQGRLVVDTGNFVSLMGAGLTEDVSDGDGEVVVWVPLSLLLPGLLVSGSLHSSQGLEHKRQRGDKEDSEDEGENGKGYSKGERERFEVEGEHFGAEGWEGKGGGIAEMFHTRQNIRSRTSQW